MSNRKHVSLDLETLGSGPHAAVVAIGAAEFIPATGKILDTFYAAITAESAVAIGGRIEPNTVMWWFEQEEAARLELVKADMTATDALRQFAKWLPSKSLVWGNGSGFDNARLREAYWDADIPCPFHFRDDMDLRTLRQATEVLGVAANVEPTARVGTHHNALDDAMFQAHLISSFFRAMQQ